MVPTSLTHSYFITTSVTCHMSNCFNVRGVICTDSCHDTIQLGNICLSFLSQLPSTTASAPPVSSTIWQQSTCNRLSVGNTRLKAPNIENLTMKQLLKVNCSTVVNGWQAFQCSTVTSVARNSNDLRLFIWWSFRRASSSS